MFVAYFSYIERIISKVNFPKVDSVPVDRCCFPRLRIILADFASLEPKNKRDFFTLRQIMELIIDNLFCLYMNTGGGGVKWGAGVTFDWLFFDNSKLIDFDC